MFKDLKKRNKDADRTKVVKMIGFTGLRNRTGVRRFKCRGKERRGKFLQKAQKFGQV